MDQKLDVAKTVQDLGIAARAAARELARAETAVKNRALEAMAAEIRKQSKAILAANAGQVEAYRGGKEGLLGFFVGQVMKETGGKANPKVVNELLREKLGTP